MVIFLWGPDDYQRTEKKRSIIAEFKKKRSELGLGVFDLETAENLDELAGFLTNQSIFEPAKLAVLENAFEFEPAKLAKLLKPVAEEKSATVLLAEKEKPVKALGFLLEKPTISQKFEQLSGSAWESFIKTQAKRMGLKIADPAVHFLGMVYEGNSWGLVTELEKLSSLKPSIDKRDLDRFDLEAAPNYWALINGLKSYDLKNRLYSFEKMLSLNDPPAKVFNILASQWQEKIPHMAEYDLAVKSGKVDYEEALVDLLIS